VPVTVDWQVRPRLATDAQLAAAAEAALAHGGRAGVELGLVLVDDAALCALHERWMGDPSPTDVLSFDLGAELGGPAGEVYVSVDCARRVARERELDPVGELLLYVVHGVLHLCGYDDREPADRRRMRAAERKVLAHLEPIRSSQGRAVRSARSRARKKTS
jgi:probable rRNA maturation factor